MDNAKAWRAAQTPEMKKDFYDRVMRVKREKMEAKRRPGKFYCHDCNRYKDIDLFYRGGAIEKYGRGYCKTHFNKRQADRYISQSVRILSGQRQRRLANPSKYKWWETCGGARKRGVPVCGKIEFADWYRSQIRECVYCLMSEEESVKRFRTVLSIDRKNNTLGYFPDNMVLACYRCNTVKNSFLTYDQMMTVAAMFFRPKSDLMLVEWGIDQFLQDFDSLPQVR